MDYTKQKREIWSLAFMRMLLNLYLRAPQGMTVCIAGVVFNSTKKAVHVGKCYEYVSDPK